MIHLILLLVAACPVSLAKQPNSYLFYNDLHFEEKIISTIDADVYAHKHKKSMHYAQAGQDLAVLTLLDGKTGGFYVDLAANHFHQLSNTFALDVEYDFRGVCIEPNQMYLHGLVARRSCDVVVNPVSDKSGDHITFRMNHVYGGIVGSNMDNKPSGSAESDLTLETVTLTETLDYVKAPREMDYLSLDVEGAELMVPLPSCCSTECF